MVFRELNKKLSKIIDKYGDEFVFCIFTYGVEQNVEAVVIPTFAEICLNEPLIFDEVDGVKIVDIRASYHGTRDGYPELIEGLYTDNIIIAPRYEHLFQNLFKSKREEIRAGIERGVPAEELKIALMKTLRTAWNDTSNAVKFIKQLTDAEKLALEGIRETIGDEGTFSQAKVASAIGVSRLTMTNLVQKMKTHEIAEVNFLGPKGTYVRFIDDTVLNIRGNNNV